MGQLINQLKRRAKQLEIEIYALYFAYRDPRVPWYARFFIACVVGYAFSPIDLIPDFIPVIGYLDDLILVPLGIKVALSMIPGNVLIECREKAQSIIHQGKPVYRIVAIIIVSIWIFLVAVAIVLIIRFLDKPHH
jgi:uncharacterized membrane protein YkvA (DUF1232 family)